MIKRTFFLAMFLALTLMLLSVGVAPVVAQNEGQIGGIVYKDRNGNGIREEGEPGLKSVEVSFESGDWSTTISTDDNGAFSIGVNPATWTVTVIPPEGYTIDEPSREVFIEKAGDAVTNVEFGLVPVTDTGDEEGDVLPESGGIISSRVVIGGLVGVLLVGIALVVIGQRRSKGSLS